MAIFSPERTRRTAATNAATIFLKKAFCIVGTFPDRRTKTDIIEKKKAASRINRIPFPRLLFFCRIFTS